MNKNIKKRIKKSLPEPVIEFLRKTITLLRKFKSNPKIPQEELRIFSLLKDKMDIVFDIGAREDISFYKIKNDCVYHLFEPCQKAVKSLRRQILNLTNHQIKINEFGLSDKNEDDCVYFTNSQSFVINPVLEKGYDSGERYSLRKLDDYVANNNIPKIDFLKIDAEGLDYRIMLGGIKTIKEKVSYIQFEYWDGVKKFVDLLGNEFNLFLMMEPELLKIISNEARKEMTVEQLNTDYSSSIIPLDTSTIDLIDRVLPLFDAGGNILGINKKIPQSEIGKIVFKL